MAVADYAQSAWDSARKFWADFDLKKWSEHIGGSSSEAVEAAVYFCLSFGVGFLVKKYFKLLFFSSILAILMIKAMEYNHLLVIDWAAVKSFLGISGASDVNVLMNHAFDWIKAHVLLFIAISVGFLVGYKLG